jgi:N-acetylglucosamine kinase-like BadF-type ATPase
MSSFVGIDGGGTKTLVMFGDERGEEIKSFTVGSTNHHSSSVAHVKKSIGDIFTALGDDISDIEGICFAGAGVDTEKDAELYTGLFREYGYKKHLFVCSDGLAALVGSNNGLNGAILIAGTGSITLGVTGDGRLARAGGWGYRTEGCCSGYSIAVEGIKAAGLEYDGIGPKTLITEKLRELLGISDFPEIVDAIYNKNMSNEKVAALSRAVTGAYNTDETARAIIG